VPSRTRKERAGNHTRKQTNKERTPAAARARPLCEACKPAPGQCQCTCRACASALAGPVPGRCCRAPGRACPRSLSSPRRSLRGVLWVLTRGTLGTDMGYSEYSHGELRVLTHGTSSSSGKAGAPSRTGGVLRVLTQGTPSTHAGYSEYSRRVLRVLTQGTAGAPPRSFWFSSSIFLYLPDETTDGDPGRTLSTHQNLAGGGTLRTHPLSRVF
jgi:hypothetical protein